jgi:integrase/recombinase XerD
MKIEEALEAFYFRNKSLSPQTQIWYERRLNAFAAWLKSHGYMELEQLTARIISAYLDELASRDSLTADKPLSTYTQHGHARIIRTWVNWLELDEDFEEHIQPRIGKKIPMPRIQKKAMCIFSKSEIKRLFAACEDDSTWPDLVARNKAILALLLDTGIRAAELCGLTLDNCFLDDDEQPYLKVMGKGAKEREVGVGKLALAHLQHYLEQYRLATSPDLQSGRHILAHLPAREKHVFIGLKYEPLPRNGLQQLLRRLAIRARVDDVHPHKFRHTFACFYLMQEAGDLHMLSRLMGHTDTQITSTVYLAAVKSIQARKLSKSVLDHLL